MIPSIGSWYLQSDLGPVEESVPSMSDVVNGSSFLVAPGADMGAVCLTPTSSPLADVFTMCSEPDHLSVPILRTPGSCSPSSAHAVVVASSAFSRFPPPPPTVRGTQVSSCPCSGPCMAPSHSGWKPESCPGPLPLSTSLWAALLACSAAATPAAGPLHFCSCLKPPFQHLPESPDSFFTSLGS